MRIERVDVRGVTKSYGATVALRGVDATFVRGSLTLVTGPNGSGKSTLLGILGGVMRPGSGVVTYAPLGTDVEPVRHQLGWVSHESLTYPDLTARENVALAARLHGLAEEEAWGAARDRFDLAPFAGRTVRTLSRGQRQRVALARAVVHRPAVLLLDEPTTGLDRAGAIRVRELVADELAAGAIVIVVSHELDLFRDQFTATLALDRGRVVRPRSPSS